MRTFQLASIALALCTSLAACGGGSDVPATPAAAPVRTVDDAHEAGILHAQPETTALTATTPRAVTPVAVTPRDVAVHTQPSATRGELTIRRATLATGIADHEPVAASDSFDAHLPRLYLFLDVRNTDSEDATLTVSFVRTDLADAREVGGVTLTVPQDSRRYRTWAWTRQAHTAGAWTAIVRDAHGDEVTRVPFTVR
jgi:hypothetical protein